MTRLLKRDLALVDGAQWDGDARRFAHLVTRDIVRIGDKGDFWLLQGPRGANGWVELPRGTWVLDYSDANGFSFFAVGDGVVRQEFLSISDELFAAIVDELRPVTPADIDHRDDAPQPPPRPAMAEVAPPPPIDPSERPGEFHGGPAAPPLPPVTGIPPSTASAFGGPPPFGQGTVEDPAVVNARSAPQRTDLVNGEATVPYEPMKAYEQLYAEGTPAIPVLSQAPGHAAEAGLFATAPPEGLDVQPAAGTTETDVAAAEAVPVPAGAAEAVVTRQPGANRAKTARPAKKAAKKTVARRR